MSTCWQRVLTLAGMLSLLLPPSARAQTFTNSATLNATLSGTNLVITYSLMNTQGWVTLFQAGSLGDLAAAAQPFDLAPAPGSGQGQFTVPVNPAAPSQFYRLLIEQWPSRGKALVWTNGPLNFAAMRATYGDITNSDATGTNTTPMIFNQPVQVWIDNLGTYDTNGVLVGGNTNYLKCKYGSSWLYSMNNASVGFPLINPIFSTNNDFRVNYLGDTNVDPRTALLWSSQVQLYHDINDYRNRFFNDAFIDELNLPTNIAVNVKQHQFRPDLNMGTPPNFEQPTLEVYEDVSPTGLRQFPIANTEVVWARTRGPILPFRQFRFVTMPGSPSEIMSV